jgi:hypothetical protein
MDERGLRLEAKSQSLEARSWELGAASSYSGFMLPLYDV